MVEEFLRGAKEAGAETENVILAEKRILPCKGKFECWMKTPGKCTIRDDMDELFPRFLASDIVVFAFPVYLENVPAIMKTFLERLIPALLPHFEEAEKGEYRHAKRFEKYPKIVVISNSGLPGQVNFQAVSFFFKRFAKHFHTEVIAEIYRGEGEILGVKNLLAKPLVSKYKKLLQAAGKALVENMEIPEELQKQLEKSIIPPFIYIKYGNEELENMLEKSKIQ